MIVAICFVVFIGLGDSSQVYCDDLRFSSIDKHYHLPTSRKKVTGVILGDKRLETTLTLIQARWRSAESAGPHGAKESRSGGAVSSGKCYTIRPYRR